MAYQIHFQHADDIITHLNSFVPRLSDPLLQVKYVGFIAIAAVTVYEIAIKHIFIEFGTKKHQVLGNFTASFFEHLNGRIRIGAIRDDYIRRFGERYIRRFDKQLEIISHNYMLTNKRDIISAYSNLITWRNDFAHEGTIKTNATYPDVVLAYEDGKEIIRCIAETMTR
jgi:hypothetical protein